MWFKNWYSRGVWKSVEMLARETLECFKSNLMRHSSQISEDQNANVNADGKDQAQEISFGNKDPTG